MVACAEFLGRSWATCTRGVEGCICGITTPERVANILEAHNKWRRSDDSLSQIDPAVLGKALDAAVVLLRSPK